MALGPIDLRLQSRDNKQMSVWILTFTLVALAQFSPFGEFRYPMTLPPYGTDPHINPFFLGENTMMGPDGLMLNTQFQLPVGTTVDIQNPMAFQTAAFDPNALWKVRLNSIPQDSSWLDIMREREYYMSLSDLRDKATTSDRKSRYRRFTETLKVVSKEPVRPAPVLQNSTTQSEAQPPCQGKGCAPKRQRPDGLSLAALNAKILNQLPKSSHEAFKKPWQRLLENWDKFDSDYMAFIDFRIPSTKNRFYMVNVKTGNVEAYRTTHSAKSAGTEKDRTWGYPVSYDTGAGTGSKLSTYGFFSTSSVKCIKYKECVRLQGLDVHNKNAFDRGVEVHTFFARIDGKVTNKSINDFGNDTDVVAEGCFGLDKSIGKYVTDRLIAKTAMVYAEPCTRSNSCPAFSKKK